MTSTRTPNRLHTQLTNMIELEAAIEQNIEDLIPAVSAHTEVTTLLTGFLTMTRAQRQALETRLQTISDGKPTLKVGRGFRTTQNDSDVRIKKGNAKVLSVGSLSQGADYPVSTALQTIYTLFHQAVFGYAILHSFSTRFLDSPYVAQEGTSYHLTRQHMEHYIQAIQQISRLINDVVLWELDEEGYECQCACISCRSGICLCAHAGRAFLSNTWAAAGPIAADEGVYVQLLKQHSSAAKAGLRKGDVILGANGVEFKSFWDIFSVLENTKSGEAIQWMVRRDSDRIEEIPMVHSSA